jgi:hypothetical protein
VNRNIYSCLGSYQTKAPIVISTKFPAPVMVLRVMSNEGDVQLVWEKEVWHPIWPDGNPSYYFACSVTESKVKAKPQNKTEDLIQKIKEVIGHLDRDTVAKACNSFKLKIENFVTADSDFIK